MAKDFGFGLKHVGIYTHNMEESVAFYKEIFGFETLFTIVGDDVREFDITVMRKNNFELEILKFIHSDEDVRTEALNTPNHFALTCSDTKAFIESLKDKNIDFESEEDIIVENFGEPKRTLDIIFLHGPSGERIEIYQEDFQ